jgi:hypothetical protein
MPPPKLAADAPVADVLVPGLERLGVPGGVEAKLAFPRLPLIGRFRRVRFSGPVISSGSKRRITGPLKRTLRVRISFVIRKCPLSPYDEPLLGSSVGRAVANDGRVLKWTDIV